MSGSCLFQLVYQDHLASQGIIYLYPGKTPSFKYFLILVPSLKLSQEMSDRTYMKAYLTAADFVADAS